jgi:hypothetical protein
LRASSSGCSRSVIMAAAASTCTRATHRNEDPICGCQIGTKYPVLHVQENHQRRRRPALAKQRHATLHQPSKTGAQLDNRYKGPQEQMTKPCFPPSSRRLRPASSVSRAPPRCPESTERERGPRHRQTDKQAPARRQRQRKLQAGAVAWVDGGGARCMRPLRLGRLRRQKGGWRRTSSCLSPLM